MPNFGSVFRRPEGYFVGKLVSDCGLKGYTIGGAQVSEKHAGFIINKGNATAEDVMKLIEYTKEQILKAVLSMSPVEVQVVSNVANNKVVNFNVKNRTIEVSENAEINSIIQGLVREIASIHTLSFAESEFNTFKNESVAYMVSKRYGIPTNNFNFEKIPEELKAMTPQEVKQELGNGAECFEILAEGMDRTLGMNTRTKTNREYER